MPGTMGQVSAPDLAKRFEVSVRTIYRDIDCRLSGAARKRVAGMHFNNASLSKRNGLP
jgi:predicted DNA-binding transcriptional regulator YafY